MLKVCAACGSGMGSSQIIKMKMSNVFKRLGIPVQISHASVGEAKSTYANFDVIFCSQALESNFDHAKSKGVKIVTLKNILSEKEIEEKIAEAGITAG